ncbi:MAG: SpoIID/LytB domain-containing protein [Candidatus Omnitrophica bacterium]|nr:SpoIID/LytB domain-containing protein [Candidatus Omnitrophota bacterium]
MKKRPIKIILAIVLISLLNNPSLAASSAPTRDISYPIRVAVLKGADRIKLKIQGRYTIYALPLLTELSEGDGLNNVEIRPTYSGLMIGGDEFKIYGVKIKGESQADIVIDDRMFRGEMDVIRTTDLKLLVVNHLDIEDYINGVLYHEVSHWWPMEAIKAQAIAARTFAVYRSLEAGGNDYDLTSDVYSQVYGGKTSERFRTSRAVNETSGLVLVYKNEILPAYYHATCGGHTEDASVLWKTSIRPLKGRPCSYCEQSPHYKWETTLPLDSIEEKMKSGGYKIKGMKCISILARDRSGRVEKIAIEDSLGTEKIPAHKFRLVLGPNIIRSTNFTVEVRDGSAVFTGKGWGHGVGLCQWGAYFMARRGLKDVDILMFYYPGSKVVKLKDIVKE